MNEIDVTEAVKILRNEKKLNEIKLAKAYNSYCLYPNPDDQKTWDECSTIDVAYDMAIQALEKQKAKCWIKEDRGHVEYSAVCPDCGYDTFWSDTEDFDYCPSCGQRLKQEEGGSDGSI